MLANRDDLEMRAGAADRRRTLHQFAARCRTARSRMLLCAGFVITSVCVAAGVSVSGGTASAHYCTITATGTWGTVNVRANPQTDGTYRASMVPGTSNATRHTLCEYHAYEGIGTMWYTACSSSGVPTNYWVKGVYLDAFGWNSYAAWRCVSGPNTH